MNEFSNIRQIRQLRYQVTVKNQGMPSNRRNHFYNEKGATQSDILSREKYAQQLPFHIFTVKMIQVRQLRYQVTFKNQGMPSNRSNHFYNEKEASQSNMHVLSREKYAQKLPFQWPLFRFHPQ